MKLYRGFNRNISYMLIPGLEVPSIMDQFKPFGQITVLKIMDIVCRVTGISPDDLKRKIRKRDIVEARQIFYYMCKKHTTLSLAAIGSYTKSGDHATVKYSINTAKTLMETDSTFLSKVERVKIAIKSELHSINTASA